MKRNLLRIVLTTVVTLAVFSLLPPPLAMAQALTNDATESVTETSLSTSTVATEPPVLVADLEPSDIDWTDPGSLPSGSWPTLDQVAAKSYVVIDRLSGAVILGKDEQTPQFPASTTKIMTALLALERLSLDQTITASEAAVKLPWDASKAGFVAGETTTVRDVLAGLMLPSGNEAANMLAEAISGDTAQFANLMNARALELGAKNTHFVNANGLHDVTHQTSTYDLALITAQAMRYPAFRELAGTLTYALAATNKHPYNGWAIFANTNNRLLLANSGNYRSSLIESYNGIKTGTTLAAGQCLVTAATTVSGQELVCVLFGVDPADLNGNPSSYTRTLLDEAARRISQMPAADLTTTITRNQAIDITGTDFQALPSRSLSIVKNSSLTPDLTWVWPAAETISDDSVTADRSGELSILQDQRVALTIPFSYIAKPVVSPLDQLIGRGGDADNGAGLSGGSIPSVLEWPGFKPLLMIIGLIVGLILMFSIGLSIGRRQGRKAQARRERQARQ